MNGEKWFYVKVALGAAGGAVSSLLGGWDVALKVLIVFLVADYVTGVLAAWQEKRLSSAVGAKGIFLKIVYLVPVALAAQLDLLLGQEVLRNLAVCFYIANEGVSVMENLARLGVPFPAALKEALLALKGKGE